jgi:hypothetical protein
VYHVNSSHDNLLILSGPKGGLTLKYFIYFEVDLKIKGDQGQKDKQLSNGFLTLDGVPRLSWDKMMVKPCLFLLNYFVC